MYNKDQIEWSFNMAKQRNRHSADIKRALKKKLKANKQRFA